MRIEDSLEKINDRAGETALKKVILSYMNIAIGLCGTFVALVLFIRGLYSWTFYGALGFTLCSSILSFQIAKIHNIRVSASLLLSYWIGIIAVVSIEKGGMNAAAVIGLTPVPLVAFLFFRRTIGFCWCGGIILFFLFLSIFCTDYNGQSIQITALLFATVFASTSLSYIFTSFNATANSRSRELASKLALTSQLAALGEMSGGIAHEINNPLAIITGFAKQMIKLSDRSAAPQESFKDLSKKILLNAERIEKIITGMKSLCRDSSQDEMQLESLYKITKKTGSYCRQKLSESNINLEIDIDESILILCRTTEIEQILINLITNAKDAVKKLPEKWIRISASESETTIEVAVTDSGSGIEKSTAKKIMNPFFTTKKPGEGTGLGLSLSNEMMTLHGGHLELNQNNKNTQFILTFPKQNNGNFLHEMDS